MGRSRRPVPRAHLRRRRRPGQRRRRVQVDLRTKRRRRRLPVRHVDRSRVRPVALHHLLRPDPGEPELPLERPPVHRPARRRAPGRLRRPGSAVAHSGARLDLADLVPGTRSVARKAATKRHRPPTGCCCLNRGAQAPRLPVNYMREPVMETATVRIPAEKRDVLRVIASIEKTEMKVIPLRPDRRVHRASQGDPRPTLPSRMGRGDRARQGGSRVRRPGQELG